jgi:RNA polymerase sigma-70 factor (ECF subfamily)
VTDFRNVPDGSGGTTAPASTPSSLLLGLRSRDPLAWQRLAYLYAPLVRRWCRQRGLQAADTDDLIQEVFRAVLARVGDFRKEQAGDSFRGWLWTITRHKLGDHFRRAARPDAATVAALDDLPAEGPPDDNAAPDLLRRALELVRDEFEEASWQAFWGVVVEDRSPAAVAEERRLSVNAVYLAKSRVLRRLRDALGESD